MVQEKKQLKTNKSMKNLRGKLRQKGKAGNYYYRLTIANGIRKEFALKTSDKAEAVEQAALLDTQWEAPTLDVAVANIHAVKGFSKINNPLTFSEAWEKYNVHPDRAMPATNYERLAYKQTYDEFVAYVSHDGTKRIVKVDNRKTHEKAAQSSGKIAISYISEITPEICEKFSQYLKSTNIAVNTHNRKIRRLKKIFSCLKEYYNGDNPFSSKVLSRKMREEQGNVIQRQAFTREQEQSLLEVLNDTVHQVMNKDEIRRIFYIGMYTGQRLKDCVLLQWQNVDLGHDRIWVKQFKTGKEVIIPIATELKPVLEEAYKLKQNQYVNPKTAERYTKTGRNGRIIGDNLVDLDVMRVIKWIGLETAVKVPGRKKAMTQYGFHSLRHSFVSFCAEAGVPKATLLSILGTDSEIADKYYTHVGDESQRAAVNSISGRVGKSPQDKINDVLILLNANPEPTVALLEQIKKILS